MWTYEVKAHPLPWGKIRKKNAIDLSSAEFAQRILNVNFSQSSRLYKEQESSAKSSYCRMDLTTCMDTLFIPGS